MSRKNEWQTRDELAATFGVSVQHFDRSIRPLIPSETQQADGRRPLFLARAAIDAWVEHETSKRLAKLETQVSGGDPMLANGEASPALERYRDARAALAELDLQERRNNLLDRAQMHEFLSFAAGIIRQATGQLERKYDAEARGIIDEALDELEEQTHAFFTAVSDRSEPTAGD